MNGFDPIVITGASLISGLGLTRQETWRSILAGRCASNVLTAMESEPPPGSTGGQAVELPADFEPAAPREVRYLKLAVQDALSDAGLSEVMPHEPGRCGFMLGTTLHGMRAGGEFFRSENAEPLKNFLAGATLKRAAEGLPIRGFAATTCSACSSSLGSIALAVTLLHAGELDLVIAGGYDTISEYAFAGFTSLRLVSPDTLRPFSKDRRGMKLGEGYGIVVLERARDARARKARPLATVLGWGESADAHHLTQPHPHGEGAARSMSAAISSAGLTPSDIDLIAAHATGTPDNDAGEAAAIRGVFGDGSSRIPIVGFKSHLGHTLGGAGAVELILSIHALADQIIPACANLWAEENEFPDLRVTTGRPERARIRATLSISLGFGGANTSVVLGAPPEVDAPAQFATVAPRLREVVISGVGVLVPGAVGNAAFVDLLHRSAPASLTNTGAVAESDYLHLLSARRVRRMSDYVKLTLAATSICLADAGIVDFDRLGENCSAILGTTHGSSIYCGTYYGQIVKQGIVGANPMLFAEGVPNAAAAHLSLMLSLKGSCQTIIGTRTAGLDALRLAAARIRSGQWERALVGAGEEFDPLVNRAYRHCGLHAGGAGAPAFDGEGGFVIGSGAVTLLLESREALERRGGRALGIIAASCSIRSTGVASASRRPESALVECLKGAEHILTSANATWIDRSEMNLIRNATGTENVTSIYGNVAETFSAGPLLGIAAKLLSNPLYEKPFVVLATDFTRVTSAARIIAISRPSS